MESIWRGNTLLIGIMDHELRHVIDVEFFLSHPSLDWKNCKRNRNLAYYN